MPGHDPRGGRDPYARRRAAAEAAGISLDPPPGIDLISGPGSALAVIDGSMSDLELANEMVRVAGYDRLYAVLMRLAGRLVCGAEVGDDVLVVTKTGAVVRGRCTEADQDWASVDVHGDNQQELRPPTR
jgi:hypothetical protein